jgi:hypothetical protein
MYVKGTRQCLNDDPRCRTSTSLFAVASHLLACELTNVPKVTAAPCLYHSWLWTIVVSQPVALDSPEEPLPWTFRIEALLHQNYSNTLSNPKSQAISNLPALESNSIGKADDQIG